VTILRDTRKYDIERIKSEWKDIERKLKERGEVFWNDTQLMVQNNGEGEHYQNGAGNIWDGKKEMDEKKFIHTNSLFKDTIFEEILNEWNGYRARILWLAPKSLYSLHHDPTGRVHLVIETNESTFFVFPREKPPVIEWLPDNGHLYLCDTKRPHTYINAHSFQRRLHMVFCIKEKSLLEKAMESNIARTEISGEYNTKWTPDAKEIFQRMKDE